jgi:hypothetical protein
VKIMTLGVNGLVSRTSGSSPTVINTSSQHSDTLLVRLIDEAVNA